MAVDESHKKNNWFQQLKVGLDKSRIRVAGAITDTFSKRKLDQGALGELEAILIQGDLGVSMASKLSNFIGSMRFDSEISDIEIRKILSEKIESILTPIARPIQLKPANCPHVILVCGVNGSGKTTTIGKLALKWRSEGKAVALVAADTFRAAAVDQLEIWAERSGCSLIAGKPGADPAGLVFNALEKTHADNTDILIVDTAGRLQNRKDLMDELEKIVRVIKKIDPDAPHDTILVLDATIGQNTINQVETFKEAVNISGLVLTKLDGSAKGGVVVALAEKFKLPVHAVGIGEGIEDLQPFHPRGFCQSLLGLDIED